MGIPILDGDVLQLITQGSSATITRLIARVKRAADRQIVQVPGVVATSSSDRSLASTNGSSFLPEGELVSAYIDTNLTTLPTQPGILWAAGRILRRTDALPTVIICSGYIWNGATSICYPTGSTRGNEDFGIGAIRVITTANPAAGVEVAASAVPANARWKLLSYTVQLVQGITQTPLPSLRIRSLGATVIAQIPITPTVIAVSSTSQLTWGRGLVQTSFTGVVGDEMHTAPLPLIDLVATDDIATITDGIGANTDYGAATLVVEELLSG